MAKHQCFTPQPTDGFINRPVGLTQINTWLPEILHRSRRIYHTTMIRIFFFNICMFATPFNRQGLRYRGCRTWITCLYHISQELQPQQSHDESWSYMITSRIGHIIDTIAILQWSQKIYTLKTCSILYLRYQFITENPKARSWFSS